MFQIQSSSSSLQLVSPKELHLSSSSASRLVLKHNTELHSNNLTVVSGEGMELFSVGQETGVRIGTGRLVSDTATLGSALQTPAIQSRAGQSLSIQSPTRYYHATLALGILILINHLVLVSQTQICLSKCQNKLIHPGGFVGLWNIYL